MHFDDALSPGCGSGGLERNTLGPPEGAPRDLGSSISPVFLILQRPRLERGISETAQESPSLGQKRSSEMVANALESRALSVWNGVSKCPLLNFEHVYRSCLLYLSECLGQRSVRYLFAELIKK